MAPGSPQEEERPRRELLWTRRLGCRGNTDLRDKAVNKRGSISPRVRGESGPTTDDAQTGLEAVVRALQLQLVVHLGVDVLQRRQRRAARVAVVPAHQGQAAHEQVLTDLKERTGAAGDKPPSPHPSRIGRRRVTSSSTAEAASLSPSLVRQGNALRTVSTETTDHHRQT